MSIDNTIVILEFSDGFRVEEVFASEDLTHPHEGDRKTLHVFRNSRVYASFDEALLVAQNLEKDCATLGFPVEYGIQVVRRDFPN